MMALQQEYSISSIEHEEYGKLTICRNYNQVKPLFKEKFEIISQDNEKEICYIQLHRSKKIIPMTFSAMIYLLRN